MPILDQICIHYMPPMGTLFARWDGIVTERQINYYHTVARGGVGLVVVEYAYVHQSGKVYNGQLAVDRDQTIDGLRKLARAIKHGGAATALQIVHGGRVCFPEITGSLPLAPSTIPSVGQALPRAVTIEEIKKLVRFFSDASARAKEAEFDIIELHMAHGYLIHSFLSPITNQRTDSYGGSLVNRARFPIEVLESVKKTVGDGVQVTCKITGSDYKNPLCEENCHCRKWTGGNGRREDSFPKRSQGSYYRKRKRIGRTFEGCCNSSVQR
jgi:NADPH2 dehydrogenase